VALSLHNLLLLHEQVGDLDIAQRYGQESLALEEALYPPNHPSIGLTVNVLGLVAQKRGDRAKARALYERSIAIYESSKRPDNPDIAHALRNLAGLSSEEGEKEQAQRLYERALALRRKAYGDRHPEVAESWHDVALARGRLAPDDLKVALESIRGNVDTFRSTLPADSSPLARELFFLGDVLRLNGRSGEALPYLEEAQAIWIKRPPSNTGDLADLEAALAATRAVPL
jgi:tetratricopeptide (TPR) repeat protein